MEATLQTAREAGVAETTLDRVLALGFQYGLDETEVTALVQTLTAAAGDNLPTGPLADKINEGLAKRVRIQAIEGVLNQKTEQYRFVRQVAIRARVQAGQPAEAPAADDLARMADALSAGISPDELSEFLSEAPAAPWGQVVHAVDFLAVMQQARIETRAARDLVINGLKNRYFTESRWELARTIRAAKRKHLSDEEITESVEQVMSGRKSMAEVQKAFGLTGQDLDQGATVSPGPSSGQSGGSGRGSSGGVFVFGRFKRRKFRRRQ